MDIKRRLQRQKTLSPHPIPYIKGDAVGHSLEKEVEIINVPNGIHLGMETMTEAVTIGYPLHHIGCAMATPTKYPIW